MTSERDGLVVQLHSPDIHFWNKLSLSKWLETYCSSSPLVQTRSVTSARWRFSVAVIVSLMAFQQSTWRWTGATYNWLSSWEVEWNGFIQKIKSMRHHFAEFMSRCTSIWRRCFAFWHFFQRKAWMTIGLCLMSSEHARQNSICMGLVSQWSLPGVISYLQSGNILEWIGIGFARLCGCMFRNQTALPSPKMFFGRLIEPLVIGNPVARVHTFCQCSAN